MAVKGVIGISACLLGDPVRYDGKSKPLALLDDPRFSDYEFHRFCPEVEIGLPIPRPPIQIIATDSGEQCVGVAEPDKNFTQALSQLADQQAWLSTLSAYIFKARSPSCGVDSTPLWLGEQEIGVTSGIFSARVCEKQAELLVVDEAWLEQPGNLDLFFSKIKS